MDQLSFLDSLDAPDQEPSGFQDYLAKREKFGYNTFLNENGVLQNVRRVLLFENKSNKLYVKIGLYKCKWYAAKDLNYFQGGAASPINPPNDKGFDHPFDAVLNCLEKITAQNTSKSFYEDFLKAKPKFKEILEY